MKSNFLVYDLEGILCKRGILFFNENEFERDFYEKIRIREPFSKIRLRYENFPIYYNNKSLFLFSNVTLI